MTREEMLKRVNAIFCEAFEDEDMVITEASSAGDIEDWDSLMQITLISAVEDTFDVEFDLKDAKSMKNVGDMLDIIIRKTNS